MSTLYYDDNLKIEGAIGVLIPCNRPPRQWKPTPRASDATPSKPNWNCDAGGRTSSISSLTLVQTSNSRRHSNKKWDAVTRWNASLPALCSTSVFSRCRIFQSFLGMLSPDLPFDG
jgi:hypothetical protein